MRGLRNLLLQLRADLSRVLSSGNLLPKLPCRRYLLHGSVLIQFGGLCVAKAWTQCAA